ncbi:MAG: cation-translocating P-type ATPase [Micrococcales bacterium]|nr:cation-translocating P-type ATPase [Micrococcales bacterium]
MTLWHTMEAPQVADELGANATSGLNAATVDSQRQRFGLNQFEEQKPEGIGRKILHNLREVTTIILLIAAALSLVMALNGTKGYFEFGVIFGIVVLNVTLAVTQERSAEKSLAALKSLNSPTTVVLRDGVQQEVASAQLVPGDVMVLGTGDMVSADARLLESTDLQVDESALTGESIPSQKDFSALLDSQAVIGDQINMVFSGCLVTAGRGRAVVTATGMDTQMGLIAGYLNNAQKLKTPLQHRIDGIGKVVSIIAVGAALTILALGLFRQQGFLEMSLVAVSVGVAAVPEMLALIVTLSLAHGVTEMVKQNALIRKLPAVETLGSTSVICSDKTGTLTQNRMEIKRLWREGGDPFADSDSFSDHQAQLLHRFALANNAVAETDSEGSVMILGSPTEAAVVRLLVAKGLSKVQLDQRFPRVAEIAFSSERKMMTTVHQDPAGGYLVLTSGAFDRVPFAVASDIQLATRHQVHDDFAHDALRVLALGSKHVETLPPEDRLGELERDLAFDGIIGIIDPPRAEAGPSVTAAKNAGIRTVMITGDHAVTAGAIAREVGILSEGERVLTGQELAQMDDDELVGGVAQFSVYARVSPEDKIRIVEAWQEHEAVVAMTGDGVNDAPALKAADVGVAMGIAGTEVAKGAADVVLTDDNFSTIVQAVNAGRVVFANIRKTVYFLLTCNFSEIAIMLAAMLIGWGLPLTPLMLLLINVVGDGIPGLRLAYEKAEPRLMQRGPIGRTESLFKGLHFFIAIQAMCFVSVALTAFFIGAQPTLEGTPPERLVIGQTMCFLTLGFAAIGHVFTVRSRQSVFKRTLRDNPLIAFYAFAMMALFALFVLVEPVGSLMGLVPITAQQWLVVLGLAVVPTVVAEVVKLVRSSSETHTYRRRLVRHRPAED